MKFRAKTILGIALIEGVLLTILGFNVLGQLRATEESELSFRAATTTRLLSASIRDALIADDLATIQSVVEEAISTGDVAYVRILNADKANLVQRGATPAGPFSADKSIWQTTDDMYDREVPIEVAGQSFGYIQFGIDVAPLQAQLSMTRQRILAISVLEMLLVAAFSWILGTYLTRQLDLLRNASQKISVGDLSTELRVSGSDELAETAAAFNQMALKLREEERIRAINEVQLIRQMEALNALNEVASINQPDPLTTLRSALTIAAEMLQLEFGIVSHVGGDEFEIVVQISPDGELHDGQRIPLSSTYCSNTLAGGDLLAIPNVVASPYHQHPCFQSFGLASYLGIPLQVRGEIFGTLGFSSRKPRHDDFNSFQLGFVRLLSRWVSAVMERTLAKNELEQSKERLSESMQELKAILDNSSVGITFVRDRNLVWANQRMGEIFGYSQEEMQSQGTRVYYPSQAAYDELGQKGYARLALGERFTTEQQMQRKNGEYVWTRISGKYIADKSPVRGSIWVFEDISERKLAEEQLRIAATAFEAQEGMVVTDAQHVILKVNQAFTEITGYTSDDAVGQNIKMLKSGRHGADFYAQMWQVLHDQGTWQGEVWNRRKSGEIYPEWLTITAVKDAAGKVAQYVATLTDITLRKAAEDEVQHLAFYDPLTLLPNRRLLLNRLQQALVVTSRTQRLGALLFIDLDNFKLLNDTQGHDVGDLLLQQVAQRLKSCVRECDTVARFGGDEFVIMLEDLSEQEIKAAAQTEALAHKILNALQSPYALAAHAYHCSASIGATLFSKQNNTVEELMKRADMAMYESKAAGRNTVRFFDPKMQSDISAHAAMVSDMRRGLKNQEFCLYYQCQVDVTGAVTGVEGLVRWRHPELGLRLPGEFIPLAESQGLILPLGHWVLNAACRQLAVWADKPVARHLSIAVNVSSLQIEQANFVEQVVDVLQRTGADPGKLKLELTESQLLNNIEETIAKMSALKAHGIGFSLDDFGTGYSSLSYLKRLPLDQLKIDQSFVRDLLHDANDVVIARTVVALGNSLGLKVIAEGVETGGQRECLEREGCLAYQGYLFGRPMPVEEFELTLPAK